MSPVVASHYGPLQIRTNDGCFSRALQTIATIDIVYRTNVRVPRLKGYACRGIDLSGEGVEGASSNNGAALMSSEPLVFPPFRPDVVRAT
jgi:hypothetical protein